MSKHRVKVKVIQEWLAVIEADTWEEAADKARDQCNPDDVAEHYLTHTEVIIDCVDKGE